MPTVREIQVVLAARRTLSKYGLDVIGLADALAHLRALYALQRHGLKGYLLDTLGQTARLRVDRFTLYADVQGTTVWRVSDELQAMLLVDYLVAHATQLTLPHRIDLLATEDGEARQFFV